MKKGISLIVLVITIIVIIILAGSVILSLADNNPISSANESKFKTNTEQYNSELGMVISNKYLLDNTFVPESFNAGKWDGTEVNKTGTIKEYITNITPEDGLKFVIQNGKLVYVGIEPLEVEYITEMSITNNGLIYPLLGVNVIATVNSTVNGQDPSYSNPIIPKGFKAINDGTKWPTDWNNGLVIEDINGNQFVWVPVNGDTVIYRNVGSYDTLPTGVTVENYQITEYEGFYIGRHEAGKVNTTLVSKKGVNVWNNINYNDAKSKAESMYIDSELKSGLRTNDMCMAIYDWLTSSNISISNSVSWGNHFNSDFYFTGNYSTNNGTSYISGTNIRKPASSTWLLNTGIAETNKAKNIYDLAGNVSEWINRLPPDTSWRNNVGGSYDWPTSFMSFNFIETTTASSSGYWMGFRVVLYIVN